MEKVKFLDVCDIQGGTQPPKSEWSFEKLDGYVRMLQIRDFTQGKDQHIEYVKDKSTLKKCKSDDILIGRYGASIGKILTGLEGAYNVAIVKTIPNEKKLNKNYLYHLLNSNNFQNFIKNAGSRAAQAGFNKEELSDFEIPLPPLATQQRIAAILDQADAIIQNNRSIVQKYDALTQSLFLDMFGDPVKNEKGWETSILKNVTSKIGSGSTPRGGKESYKTEGISLIRSMNVYDNEFYYKDLAFIDNIQADKLKNVIVEENDVLFNITGASVCRCAIVPKNILPARVNQHVAIIRPKKEILNYFFLNHLLISIQVKRDLLKLGSGGGAVMEAITKEQLENYHVILPSITIQNQFAERVAVIEAQKQQAQLELAKSEELFQSLLQRAFNGELN